MRLSKQPRLRTANRCNQIEADIMNKDDVIATSGRLIDALATEKPTTWQP